jgi:hypothetical protein
MFNKIFILFGIFVAFLFLMFSLCFLKESIVLSGQNEHNFNNILESISNALWFFWLSIIGIYMITKGLNKKNA